MTIVSIKTGTEAEFRRIELSDGSFFSFKTCYLLPVFTDESLFSPGAADGRTINSDEEESFRFASACLRAEKRALQLIARAEQNIFNLGRKLEKRGHDSACVRAVISRLCELELLDDRRYARLWVESRTGRTSTPRRLLAALCTRGIDRDDAEQALKEALDSETEMRLLERYAEKLKRRHKITAEADGARRPLKYLLRSEGFSAQAIRCFFEE